MSSTKERLELNKLPEDVNFAISRQLIDLPRAPNLTLRQREQARLLRDATFINLALTSTGMSSFWSKALRRHITMTFLPPQEFFTKVAQDPEYLFSTRSLRIRHASARKDFNKSLGWSGIVSKLLDLEHPALDDMQTVLFATWELIEKGKDSKGNLDPKRIHANGKATEMLFSSVWSLILDSMPNLTHFIADEHIVFFFVRKVEINGRMVSRPLVGLNHLKYLQFGKEKPVKGANAIWLMLFLENLTHLEVVIDFLEEDRKYIQDHKKVLVGKSKITHLFFTYQFIKTLEDKKPWERADLVTDCLSDFLSVTKGLKEVKVNHLLTMTNRSAVLHYALPSMRFLEGLQDSTSTLEHLSLIGLYAEATRAYSPPSRPPNLLRDFKSLKMLAVEQGSIIAFAIPMKGYPTFPSHKYFPDTLRYLHFQNLSDPKVTRMHPAYALMQLLQAFPVPGRCGIQEILCDPLPVASQAPSEVDMDHFQRQNWVQGSDTLKSYCHSIGIHLKFLTKEERLPYGNMPELETRP